MSEREAFEAWAFENGLQSHTDQSLDYPLGNVLWKCWQGRAAIEAQRVPDVKATDQRVTFDTWLRSACFQVPPDYAKDLARSAWYASDKQASADCEAMAEEIERLQKALAFWMPDVPSPDHPLYKRVANDVYLLVGFDGPHPEQSAFELGHVVLSSAPPVAQPAEPVTKEMWRNLAESQAELLRMQNGQAQPAERKPLEISEDDAFNLAKHVYAHTQPYDAPQILLTGKELKAIIEAAAHGIGD